MVEKKCAVCNELFKTRYSQQRYCDAHKNQHGKRQGEDRRRGPASSRAYKQRACAECGSVFTPQAAGSRYCDEHAGSSSWERRNPERHRENRRIYMRRRRHAANLGNANIYDELVERDGEKCAICGLVPPLRESLRVDHCHRSQEVRGLLCEPCNIGLGWFRDEPARLRAAAAYLETCGVPAV